MSREIVALAHRGTWPGTARIPHLLVATDKPEMVPPQVNRRIRRWLWDYGPIGILLRLHPPVPMLQPHRYAIYLRALAERRQMPGAILEVGCFRGAIAGEAFRTLKLCDAERPLFLRGHVSRLRSRTVRGRRGGRDRGILAVVL